MRRTSFAVSALAGLAVFAAAPRMVQAQGITVGPLLAFHEDADFGVGAAFATQLPALGAGFGIMADFIYFFPDGFDLFELNGNLTYDFPLENSTVVPFVLGGLNFTRVSVEVLGISGSSSDVGLNLGGGIAFDAGNFRPTVAAKVEVSGGEAFVLWATLPFQVGGDN